MANSLKGEFEIEVGGKMYAGKFHMDALVAVAAALNIEHVADLASAMQKIQNMPLVVAAVLKANKYEVDAIGEFDWIKYQDLIRAALRMKGPDEEGEAEANPPKSRAKK